MKEKKDKPPQKDELDIARGIEGALLGMFLLFGRIFRTCYTFVVNPGTFADGFQWLLNSFIVVKKLTLVMGYLQMAAVGRHPPVETI